MVKHILFVKMKDNSIEQCEKVKALFLSMKEQIPFLREVQVGIDYLHSQRSYDVVLELVVDDRQALEDYQKHLPCRKGKALYSCRAKWQCNC